MTEYITLACQLWIIVMLIGIVWMNWQTRKMVRQTSDLITRYRRELQWLEARIETLEKHDNLRSIEKAGIPIIGKTK